MQRCISAFPPHREPSELWVDFSDITPLEASSHSIENIIDSFFSSQNSSGSSVWDFLGINFTVIFCPKRIFKQETLVNTVFSQNSIEDSLRLWFNIDSFIYAYPSAECPMESAKAALSAMIIGCKNSRIPILVEAYPSHFIGQSRETGCVTSYFTKIASFQVDSIGTFMKKSLQSGRFNISSRDIFTYSNENSTEQLTICFETPCHDSLCSGSSSYAAVFLETLSEADTSFSDTKCSFSESTVEGEMNPLRPPSWLSHDKQKSFSFKTAPLNSIIDQISRRTYLPSFFDDWKRLLSFLRSSFEKRQSLSQFSSEFGFCILHQKVQIIINSIEKLIGKSTEVRLSEDQLKDIDWILLKNIQLNVDWSLIEKERDNVIRGSVVNSQVGSEVRKLIGGIFCDPEAQAEMSLDFLESLKAEEVKKSLEIVRLGNEAEEVFSSLPICSLFAQSFMEKIRHIIEKNNNNLSELHSTVEEFNRKSKAFNKYLNEFHGCFRLTDDLVMNGKSFTISSDESETLKRFIEERKEDLEESHQAIATFEEENVKYRFFFQKDEEFSIVASTVTERLSSN